MDIRGLGIVSVIGCNRVPLPPHKINILRFNEIKMEIK